MHTELQYFYRRHCFKIILNSIAIFFCNFMIFNDKYLGKFRRLKTSENDRLTNVRFSSNSP